MMNFQDRQDRRQSRFAGTGYRWSFKYDDDDIDKRMFWNPEDTGRSSVISCSSSKGIKFGSRQSYVASGRTSVKLSRGRAQSQQLVGDNSVYPYTSRISTDDGGNIHQKIMD